jgi:SSS family solute:Na+ symporter
MTSLDWWIVAGFAAVLGIIAFFTNRMTKSVAGFLSSERLAGRYLLTIAMSMTFLSAIGNIGQFESYYRNGIGGMWWGMLLMPVGIIIALSGWVAYRYRQTRALTMAQFLEMRYSRNFRVFSGLVSFFSGVLNCAVFPMVTANFLIYFLGLPAQYELLGLTLPTYHTVMLIMIGTGILLAVAGGQNTIMVTSFYQGVIASIAGIACMWFILDFFGWDNIMTTLLRSETISAAGTAGPEWFKQAVAAAVPTSGNYPDLVAGLTRPEGVSMMNPFKQGGLPDFGPSFFIMMTLLYIAKTGVWQGGAGFMTAAKSPHEARMGNILGSWRWLLLTLSIVAFSIAAYVVIWNPAYTAIQSQIAASTGALNSPYLQSQMLVPIVIRHLLPPGLLGLFAIYMIGSAVSTDNSTYHSWGSIFLQDVIMPFRKKPFTTKTHLNCLRWAIVMIGAISFLFSSIWTMKDFINMWFEITGAIYIGGASCAIIGGLYWKRGTTSAAWAGLLTGSTISVGSIILKQIWPGLTFPGTNTVINGIHMAVFAVLISYAVYILVSLATCKQPFNMDQLLHRGKYAVEEDTAVKEAQARQTATIPRFLRMMGITREFSTGDKIIYITMVLWTTGWCLTFILGTIYNLTVRQLTSEEWKFWWTVMLGIQGVVSVGSAIWFTVGGIFDVTFLFKKLARLEVNEHDDGTVHKIEE